MILLENGGGSGSINLSDIKIDGVDYTISGLLIELQETDETISISHNGAMLYYQQHYSNFTTDGTSYTPIASFNDLLIALNSLYAYNVPGVKARKLRSAAGNNAHVAKVGATLLHSILVM